MVEVFGKAAQLAEATARIELATGESSVDLCRASRSGAMAAGLVAGVHSS